MLALNGTEYVTLPEAIITASEGANLHLDKWRSHPEDFDLATRDRFLAVALIPSSSPAIITTVLHFKEVRKN